jgi:hypothetical protein
VQGPVIAPQPNGTNPTSYDLWIHDTNGTPDDPSDDADFPVLTLNGPLALRPTWSPDGSMIAFVTNAASPHGPGPTSKICLVQAPPNLGTSLSVQYFCNFLTDDKFNDVAPTWDPGSSWVAFSSTRKDLAGQLPGGNRTIWKIQTDTTALEQVTGTQGSSADDTNPAWSAGSYIAFQSNRLNADSTYDNRIWIINSQTPEDAYHVPLQISGINESYQGGDQNPTIGQQGLFGIDISDSAGPLSDSKWSEAISAGVTIVVVNAYAGVDTASKCCVYTKQNLTNAQNLPGIATAIYVEPTFTSTYPTQMPNYGTYIVDDAYGEICGFGAAPDPLNACQTWKNLKFVAIAAEPYTDNATMSGTQADHVTQIMNAVTEIYRLGGNPVIYARPDANTYAWSAITGNPPSGSNEFSSLPLWQAGATGGPTLDSPPAFREFGCWKSRQGKQYSPHTPYSFDGDLDVFDPNILTKWPGNTAAGSNIIASAVDLATETALLTATFVNVTVPGFTTVTSTSTGPALPQGFVLGNPATYFDVATTAVISGSIQVCLDYLGISFGNQSSLVLLHYENGQWVNRTVSSDSVNHVICANVSSLSPFVIAEPISQFAPTVNVTGGSFPYDGAAHSASAAAVGPSGTAVSGSFVFTYAPGGSASPVNTGTYAVTAQFTSADPNYTNVIGTGTITITPASTTTTTTSTARMQFARVSHQATLLADGLVLVSGGQSGGAAVPQSELYNPTTATWSLSGSNVIPRFDHSATLLLDGRVLATGGVSFNSECSQNVTAETYDPTTGQWSLTRRLESPVGTGHAAIRMQDGRVLVTGGGDRCGTVFNTSQIFDPATNQWSATSSMNVARQFHTIALLPDGRVLVVGGITSSSLTAVPSAEIYDPNAGTWTPVGSMTTARQTACNGYTQTFLANLPSGSVLAAGGFSGSNCPAIMPQRTVAAATVNPSAVQLFNIGQTLALSVTAQMSDGSTELFTGPLQFSSGDTTVVTVDSSGFVTAVGTGTTAITVSGTGISPVNIPVTVASRQLTSISVSPTSIVTIGPGVTQPLAVNGQYSEGSQQAVTAGLTFTSSNTAVATVDPTGLVTTVGNGTATITVSAQGVPSAQVTVLVRSLVSIVVSPTSLTLNGLGQTQALTVTGLYSDGSQQVLTANLSFTSSNPLVAQVNLSGFVTAVANGTATITVSVSGVAAIQVPVTVVAPLLSITKSHSGSFTQGQQRAVYTIIVSNAAGAGPSSGTVTVTDAVPAGLTLASMVGTGWVCGAASCTRNDALVAGGSYPPIAVMVNVANNAGSSVTNTATVSGGGSASAVTTDITAIAAGTPVILSVSPNSGQHGQQNISVALTGQFTNWVQGSSSASFGAGVTVVSLTVSNNTSATAVLNIDPAATPGARTVTVTTGSEVETFPDGFTVTGVPDLTIAKSHSGNFTLGQSGVAYSITITNIGTGPTNGTVLVGDTLPAGLTATAISGPGWSCNVTSVTCSRSDILGASSSYPTITVTVNIATNAGSSVTNEATVSGGGEINLTNDSASDITEIVPPSNSDNGEYDASLGTLPQAQGWSYSGDNGNPSPVVSEGLLDENTTAGGQYWSTTDSSIDLSQDAVLVAVLKIDSSNYIPDIGTGTREGYYLSIADSTSSYSIGLADAGFSINTQSISGAPLIPYSIAGAFHVFRLQVHNGLAVFSIDGIVVANNIPSWNISSSSGVVFGGGAGLSRSVSELSLFCYGNSATACSQTSLPSTPALLSINPNSGQQGQQNLPVTLTGQFTNWVQGMTTASFGTGITVTSLTVSSPTNAAAVLNVDAAATPGPRAVTMTTGSEIEILTPGFTVNGSPEETDAKPFSVLNLAGTTGGQPLSLEADSKQFSVLNYAGSGSVGIGATNIFEVDADKFSVLNLAGASGNQPVSMEKDADNFSVLNLSATGIGPGGTPFEIDAARFSVLNLTGESGSQPVPMEADGIPFGVQNGAATQMQPAIILRRQSGAIGPPSPVRSQRSNEVNQGSGKQNGSSTTGQNKTQQEEK